MESDDIKYQQMQDEMTRFEAEIAGEQKMRPVIASSTYDAVQQKLQSGPLLPTPNSSFSGNSIPPPPSPPSLLLPTQLQRARLPPPPTFPSFPGFINTMSPPKPQPVVMSAAPQLYKTKYRDMEPLSPGSCDIIRECDNQYTSSVIQLPIVTPLPDPPMHTPIIPPPPSISHKSSKKEKKNRKLIRTAGGQVWEDTSLSDWPDDDFRIFCGDLGNDVTDELLTRTFSKYSSFYKAKVIRDKRTNKSKGFGFISFKEPADFIKAMKEMNGRYVGSRPIKLRKSTWKARSLDIVRKKEKEKAQLIALLTGNPSKS